MGIKILITGDYCPIGRNESIIREGKGISIFGGFDSYTDQADLSISNLEAPLTKTNNPKNKSGPNIKAPEGFLKPLKEIGFDIVTLANNHILDYGEEGLKSTIKTCNNEGVKYVGAGKNLEEARKPLIIDIKGRKIALINIAENEFCSATMESYGANSLNLITNHYDIKKAKKESDFVLVISHGGREHYQLPTPQLRERYRFFIDSGADAVIGHHTHCFSGYEHYTSKPIFYSLGNFIFDYKKKYRRGLWTQGYGVLLKISDNNIDFDLIPFNQGREECPRLQLLNDEERAVFNLKIRELNAIISSDKLFEAAWRNYIKTQDKTYKASLFMQNRFLRALVSRGLLPEFYFHSKKHKTLLLNLFRCETHREIMIDILSKKYG